jgi:hypothetical protein
VQVGPIKPKLKPPGTERLKLMCDIRHSSSAFKFNLHRYNKAQGSEYRAVVLCLASSHRPLLRRELVYTAVSRAKEVLIILAPKVGPGRYRLPRHPTHCEPSFRGLNGNLVPGL